MNDAKWLARGCLHARRDLTIVPSGEATVVKDPLSLEYFRLGDRERFLLEELLEPLTVTELTRRYQRRFPNERATGAQVLAFCSSLHECGLIYSDQPTRGDGTNRARTGDRPSWGATLVSPLAIRLPGFDPSLLLRLLAPFASILFSRAFALLLALTAVGVAVGLIGRAEEFAQGLGQLTSLADPAYATMAVAAVIVAKTWHELGHALACRRMGAECHEVGVMLLAFLPCLYCDVSDAWTLPSRWRRAVVALAGVYFEAILAVLAAAAWLVLAPGLAQTLALYLVVVTTVSTLLVNLNPLLRFDGYYVLSDAWGVANLHQQSRAVLWGRLTRWVRGDKSPPEPRDAPAWLLATYGFASVAYGWVLLTLILWGSYHALKSVGFSAVGDVLLALTVGGVAFAGGRSTVGLVPRGPNSGSLSTLARLAAVLAVAVVAGGWAASLPIEQTLLAPCRLESAAFSEVVARSPGVLMPHVHYGDRVEQGDLLADLADPDAELRRLELVEREASIASDLAGLRTRSQSDPRLLIQIAQLEPSLGEVQRQLLAHDHQTEKCRLRAPRAGRVAPPSERPRQTQEETPEGDLLTWGGAPLDAANAGCQLEGGEPLCRVVGEGLRAVLLLGEDDSGLVRLGDPVRLILDRTPSEPLVGRVERVALAAADERLTDTERRLENSLQGPLQHRAAYRVVVSLPDAKRPDVHPGALGKARIVTGEESVGGRFVRWLRQLLRFS